MRINGHLYASVSKPDVLEIEMYRTPNLPKIIDVRQIARPVRHPLIFSTFDRMGPKDSLHIVSDHDPRPLRYLFDVKYPDAFTWDYFESGPEVWRVRLAPAADLR